MLTNESVLSVLPQGTRQLLAKKTLQRIDLCRRENAVFYVDSGMYLKISPDVSALEKEKERDLWLENRLTAPRVIDFGKCLQITQNTPSLAFLLTTEVKGLPLCDESFLNDPDRLTSYLAEAMESFHAVDTADCPFLTEHKDSQSLLCHGDFCLPNILYSNGKFGFVDLGDMGKGDPWLDYAWCLWSLDYNLKTDKYRDMLLKKLGIDFDEEAYRRYVQFE